MEATIASHTIQDWLRNRTITDAVLSQFNVTITPQGDIVLPVYDSNGNFLFNKYRRSPFKEDGPKYRYDAGSTAALYGSQFLTDLKYVYVVEGELDALALWSNNIPAVSTTGGSGTFKKEWADLLKHIPDVFICYDNDEAGFRGALVVQEVLPSAKIVQLPRKYKVKDVTDYLMWLRDNGKTATQFLTLQSNTFPMEEFPVPEKKADIKGLKDIYNQRIKFAMDVRWHLSVGLLDTRFVDLYIDVQRGYLSNMKREEMSRKRKPTFAPGKERSVEAARRVPMTNFIKFDRQGMAKCPFHNEATASFHYILKSNKAYCFGSCQKPYDVIEVVMQLFNLSFPDALNKLTP